MGGYGGESDTIQKPEGAPDGAYYHPREYVRRMTDMIEHVRKEVGPEVELLHDIHERLRPSDAVQFAKDVEPYKLFFLEDAPRRISSGSGTFASNPRPHSRWANCSTTRWSGRR